MGENRKKIFWAGQCSDATSCQEFSGLAQKNHSNQKPRIIFLHPEFMQTVAYFSNLEPLFCGIFILNRDFDTNLQRRLLTLSGYISIQLNRGLFLKNRHLTTAQKKYLKENGFLTMFHQWLIYSMYHHICFKFFILSVLERCSWLAKGFRHNLHERPYFKSLFNVVVKLLAL